MPPELPNIIIAFQAFNMEGMLRSPCNHAYSQPIFRGSVLTIILIRQMCVPWSSCIYRPVYSIAFMSYSESILQAPNSLAVLGFFSLHYVGGVLSVVVVLHPILLLFLSSSSCRECHHRLLLKSTTFVRSTTFYLVEQKSNINDLLKYSFVHLMVISFASRWQDRRQSGMPTKYILQFTGSDNSCGRSLFERSLQSGKRIRDKDNNKRFPAK